MLRTGVVSQRLVLQVVHMEQLVAETCRCDLSPSVSRPLQLNTLISLQIKRLRAKGDDKLSYKKRKAREREGNASPTILLKGYFPLVFAKLYISR